MFDLAVGNSQSAHEMSAGTYKTEAALQASCIAAIYASIAANSYSATIAIGAGNAQDVQNVMRLFGDANYIINVVGTNIVITW